MARSKTEIQLRGHAAVLDDALARLERVRLARTAESLNHPVERWHDPRSWRRFHHALPKDAAESLVQAVRTRLQTNHERLVKGVKRLAEVFHDETLAHADEARKLIADAKARRDEAPLHAFEDLKAKRALVERNYERLYREMADEASANLAEALESGLGQFPAHQTALKVVWKHVQKNVVAPYLAWFERAHEKNGRRARALFPRAEPEQTYRRPWRFDNENPVG